MNKEKEKQEEKGKETRELLKLIAILLCVLVCISAPLLGFVLLLGASLYFWKPSKKTRQRVNLLFGCVLCPYCGEPIDRSARSCPACGETFPSYDDSQRLAKLWRRR
mgnify:CR=1 FL=1